MGLWVIIKLESHSVLSHWLTLWIICLVFCSLHSLPSPTDRTCPLPKISARGHLLCPSQLRRAGTMSSLSPRPGCQPPSRTHRGSGVLVCRDQNRPTRTTSANFEQESEEPFLAAPPTRRGISGKAEEGVGLDSYTSQRAAARSDLAMHQSKLSSFL